MKLCVLLLITVIASSASAKKAVGRIQALRNLDGRIIGGQEATAAQFPSAAAIYVRTSSGTFFCGGALISQQWVLTAAHCIQDGVSFQILLGSNTLQGTDPNRVTLATSAFINHPNFDPETLENDIGLIHLHLPVEYSDYIQPIRLPTVDQNDNMVNIAIGWGSVSDAAPSLSDHLNYVSVTSIPNSECQFSYANPIFDTMVCVVGNYNEGACRGDSGSPLMTVLNHHHWLVGVASFISTHGCETSDPSGYTRINSYVAWIKTTTGIE